MPRSVNERDHQVRRDAIIDAAYRRFAESGYDRTSTASICAAAGISSGTFFHYFPSKISVLVGILEAGSASTAEQLARIRSRSTGLTALLDYAGDLEAEMADENFAGFVAAVIGVAELPEVADAIRVETDSMVAFVRVCLAEAVDEGDLRTDVPLASLETWVRWLIDGAAQGAAEAPVDAPPADLTSAIRALVGPQR